MGVYKILCQPTGRLYVGSAVNLRTRKNLHWSQLKRQIHHSMFLQRAWNKYGESSFVFELLEQVPTAADLVVREQFYIDRLQPDFNSCPVARSSLGYRHTREARKRMSQLKKGCLPWIAGKRHRADSKMKMAVSKKGNVPWMVGRRHSADAVAKMSKAKMGKCNPNSKQIRQYTLQGVLITTFSSKAEAQRLTGVHEGSIRHVIAGRAKHAGGYFWKHVK